MGALLYGFLNFGVAFMFVYRALTEITAGTMMVILATVPLLTSILAVAERLERFSVRRTAGTITAVVGIAFVFGDSIGSASPIALLAAVAGAAAMATAPVVVKKFPRVHAVVENALGMTVGGGVLLGLSFLFAEPQAMPTTAWTDFSLAYLIVLGSIGVFLLYVFVLRRMTATGASYIMLLAPLAAVGLGALLLGEPLRPIFLIGGVLVLAGVCIGVTDQGTTSATP